MKIIEKYLIFEWLKWFFLCFLVLYSLLFLQLLNDENALLSNTGLVSILSLFVIKAIDYITWLFPISCFFSTLFTFSFLVKNRELSALLSTGFSTLNIFRPILVIALVCCALTWFCQDTERLVDWYEGENRSKQFKKNQKYYSFKMRLNSVNRTWFFENFDKVSGLAKQVHLYNYDDHGNDLFRIRSESGQKTKKGWKFNNGNFLGFSSSRGIPIIDKNNKITWESIPEEKNKYSQTQGNTPKYQKSFNEIILPYIYDDPEPFGLLRISPKDLNYRELNDLIEHFPNPDSLKLTPYRLRSAQLFWNAPACLFAIICALAIAVRREQNSIGFTIGLSLIWIIVFYMLRIFCDAMGKLGVLSEWISTGIPFFLILIFSVGQLWKNR